MDIKDTIISKCREIKKLSLESGQYIDENNYQQSIQKLASNANFKEQAKRNQEVIVELFALLDELDVIEGHEVSP